MTPRHDCDALAQAVTDMAAELEYDESELLFLLLENRPIDESVITLMKMALTGLIGIIAGYIGSK